MKNDLKQKVKKYFDTLPGRLAQKEECHKIVCIYTYIIMTIISFTMTVLNLINDVGELKYFTLGMGVLSLINLVLSFRGPKGVKVSAGLFCGEIIILFSYFVLSGNPKGFSIIWLALLPPISMLFYGKKLGSILSAVMFGILIFFLWTPMGKLLLFDEAIENYTETFRLRFPFLYLGCCALAFILALLQDISFQEVKKTSEKNAFLMKHDVLTGLYNRTGMLEVLENVIQDTNNIYIGIGIVDIDGFKSINDQYGHLLGDVAIKRYGELLKEQKEVIACRWGGDEFSFIYVNKELDDQKIEAIRNAINNVEIQLSDNQTLKLSISGGIIETSLRRITSITQIDAYLKNADHLLLKAKEEGKNTILLKKES